MDDAQAQFSCYVTGHDTGLQGRKEENGKTERAIAKSDSRNSEPSYPEPYLYFNIYILTLVRSAQYLTIIIHF
jgi:hypothetical protein